MGRLNDKIQSHLLEIFKQASEPISFNSIRRALSPWSFKRVGPLLAHEFGLLKNKDKQKLLSSQSTQSSILSHKLCFHFFLLSQLCPLACFMNKSAYLCIFHNSMAPSFLCRSCLPLSNIIY